MKTIIWIIAVIVIFIYIISIGDVEIKLNPISIRMNQYKTVVGFILLIVGASLIRIDIKDKAYEQGAKDILNEIKKQIDNKESEEKIVCAELNKRSQQLESKGTVGI